MKRKTMMTREEAIENYALFLQAKLGGVPQELRRPFLQGLREKIRTFTPDDAEVWCEAIDRAFPIGPWG